MTDPTRLSFHSLLAAAATLALTSTPLGCSSDDEALEKESESSSAGPGDGAGTTTDDNEPGATTGPATGPSESGTSRADTGGAETGQGETGAGETTGPTASTTNASDGGESDAGSTGQDEGSGSDTNGGSGAACEGNCVVSCDDAVETGALVSRTFAFGDIDGDGDMDIVAEYNAAVTVFERGEDGSYTEGQLVDTEDTHGVYGLTLSDVDDDGDLDLVTAGPNGSNGINAVLLNDRGVFRSPTTMVVSHGEDFYGQQVGAGDLTGDGIDDVVWGTTGGIRIGIGAYDVDSEPAAFPLAPTLFASDASGDKRALLFSDLDSDGDRDIVVAAAGYNPGNDGEGTLSLFLNDGAGAMTLMEFTSANIPLVAGSNFAPPAVVVADFNGDGAPDIAMTNSSNDHSGIILALRTSEDGEALVYDFTNPDLGLESGFEPYTPLRAGDLDGDGNIDLMLGTDDGLELVAGDGAGGFSGPWTCAMPRGIGAILDLNGDGALDVVDGSMGIHYATERGGE